MHSPRWLVIAGNHMGVIGYETARSDSRHGCILELAPDPADTVRIHVEIQDCRPVEDEAA